MPLLMPKVALITNYIHPQHPHDYSYIMTDQDMIANGNDEISMMETVITRTEWETETRRERFHSIEILPNVPFMSYIINLWLDKEMSQDIEFSIKT